MKTRKYKPNGFTLLEMMIVLAVLSTVLLLSVPPMIDSIEHHKEKQFIEDFNHDLLLIQNNSLYVNTNSKIAFNSDHYIVRGGFAGETLVRELPNNWRVIDQTIHIISFSRQGTIADSGTITIKSPNHYYTITFPPGKGRGHIEKK